MAKDLTIREIAKMAGVSTTTVSRVLNNNPHVSEIKRTKIQSVIEKSGFQPSMLARGMVSRKTNTFGVVVSDINNPYFTALISQIEAVARDYHYSLLLFNTMTAGKDHLNDSSQTEIQAFQSLEEKKVDGVLILGGEIDRQTPAPAYLSALERLDQQLPVVIVAQKVEGVSCHFIERYQKLSGEMITEHLLAMGYRRIAFLGGEPNVTITNQRVAGYRQMMETYADFDPQQVFLSDYYTKDGYKGMSTIIKQQQLPEAVVAINDQVALGAIRALTDHQLNCPSDIALGSCDAFPNSDYFTPRVTTIDHHNVQLAEIAVKQLLALIDEQNQTETLQAVTPPSLIIRESSGKQHAGGSQK